MQMAVHYFWNSDFRFTFPIKCKFKFMDLALYPLLKKENCFQTRYVSSCLPIRGLLMFSKLSRASQNVTQVSLVLYWSEVRTTLYTIILNSRYVPLVPCRLCSREQFLFDGQKVIGYAEFSALHDWSEARSKNHIYCLPKTWCIFYWFIRHYCSPAPLVS